MRILVTYAIRLLEPFVRRNATPRTGRHWLPSRGNAECPKSPACDVVWFPLRTCPKSWVHRVKSSGHPCWGTIYEFDHVMSEGINHRLCRRERLGYCWVHLSLSSRWTWPVFDRTCSSTDARGRLFTVEPISSLFQHSGKSGTQ